MSFVPGDVLKVEWDSQPICVLISDEIETFYDAYYPDAGWALRGRRSIIYYRLGTAFLASKAEVVGRAPLTEKDSARHRPDLPLRLFRSADAAWSDVADRLRTNGAGLTASGPAVIDAPKLALEPFGPKGASLRANIVEAANHRFFEARELLLAAAASQKAICPEVRGIGLYRSGLIRGVPSYYLWGAVDKAGNAEWSQSQR